MDVSILFIKINIDSLSLATNYEISVDFFYISYLDVSIH